MNIKNNKNCKITINDEEIAVSEKEKIKDILKTYNFNKYCQHHIQYYDLTEEIGNYGDYKILLVKVEQEWNNKAIKYYLFVDHKANVNIWELDENMEIIKEMI